MTSAAAIMLTLSVFDLHAEAATFCSTVHSRVHGRLITGLPQAHLLLEEAFNGKTSPRTSHYIFIRYIACLQLRGLVLNKLAYRSWLPFVSNARKPGHLAVAKSILICNPEIIRL